MRAHHGIREGLVMNIPFVLGKGEELVKDYIVGVDSRSGAHIHLAVTNRRIVTYGTANIKSFGTQHTFYYINDMDVDDFAGIVGKTSMDKAMNFGKIVGGIILLLFTGVMMYFNSGNSYSGFGQLLCFTGVITGIVGLILLILGIIGDQASMTMVHIKSKTIYGGITIQSGYDTNNHMSLRAYSTSGAVIYVAPGPDLNRLMAELSAVIEDMRNMESEEEEEEIE